MIPVLLMRNLIAAGPGGWALLVAAPLVSYLAGSIPWAYIIVKWRTGEDITDHGTGNVGAMNVRRTTGSWYWFALAMLLDGFKGIVPVLVFKALTVGPAGGAAMTFGSWGGTLAAASGRWYLSPLLWVPMLAVFGSVLGHNYSCWMALLKRRFARTGKGLATGAGALLAYDWRYFIAVVVVGLTVIAITRYMMAGQVAAAWTLPAAALVLRSPDWPFALVMGALVYAAHHKRFVGLLQGKEPKLYIKDGMGPKG